MIPLSPANSSPRSCSSSGSTAGSFSSSDELPESSSSESSSIQSPKHLLTIPASANNETSTPLTHSAKKGSFLRARTCQLCLYIGS